MRRERVLSTEGTIEQGRQHMDSESELVILQYLNVALESPVAKWPK